ncbi:unnamed protein product [Paramecium pentaurelia]|uniref:Uncharacterized protein n=1 Tax=Paramecium pentaurelia TaxID=43138 RepID=A0A8S1UUJ1_9CILI|nr:unnamed protein product [Paramecium pentaurelia]
MNHQKESENDDSDRSQQSQSIQQKNNERKLRKIQKLQSLINKPFYQLTQQEINKRRILSRVSDLIIKTTNAPQFLQPINQQFNSDHKFLLNINHLQNTSISKITSNITDSEKDYVDYLMIKKQKQQDQIRKQMTIKQNLKENYDQLWQQQEDLSDKEIQDNFNVSKALNIVHKSEVQKELLKSDERTQFGKNSTSVQNNSNLQSLTNSRLILMQDQDINETEYREQQARRTLKKMKTKKVINIVQKATKKIYNKKEEQIQKELIMHQVYKQMNKDNKKESIKSIDSVFRNSQSEQTFLQSQNHQKLITNKILSEKTFFQPKKLSEIKPIQSRVQLSHIIQKQDSRIDDTPPKFQSRKISLINDKITNLVSQIDLIQQKEIDQLTFIKQLENEQDLYQTYRQSLQPDQIQDTLKSLLGPSNNNYRKPFRFSNKKFFNQVL